MIDLHCHLLPGIDDGAKDSGESLEMARLFVAEGVTTVACTPHIFPGVYDNRGPEIRRRVALLQSEIDAADIPLRLVTGGDVHIAPDLVAKLKSGEALSLNDSRYVLVEPPHHVLPPRMDELFFNLLSAGFVPILTHPERMTWIDRNYDMLRQLVKSGAWMQITAGALLGTFGREPKRWSERMLREGMVHVVASDAHGPTRRPPMMKAAFRALETAVGEAEALNLVLNRPKAILQNKACGEVDPPAAIPSKAKTNEKRNMWSKVAGIFRAE